VSILEVVLFGNDTAPAISAKLDLPGWSASALNIANARFKD